jgi:DNA-binding response OmpR family regulator
MSSVLLIEGDAPVIRLVKWALEDAGIGCDVAATPQEALERTDPSPGVIVFNTGMPDDPKRAFIRHLRENMPGVKVIDLASEERQPHASTGADAYLHTPFLRYQIVDLVQDLLSA